MNRLLKVFTLIMFCSSSLIAQTDEKAATILKGVSAKYKSYSSISATFVLKAMDQKTKKTEAQSGSILIKSNQFKLVMSDQTVQSDGKTTWTYLKESNEVQISENTNDASAITPANIFTMYEKGFKSRYKSDVTVGGRVKQIIELIPEDAKKTFFKVQLQIDKTGKYVSEAKVFDKSGSIFTYAIQKFTPNTPVTADQFVFAAAKYPGVEVVDLR